MKRKFFYLVLIPVLIMGLFSSCSARKSCAALLPDDPSMVFTLDVQQLVDASGIQTNAQLKEKIGKAIAKAGLSKDVQAKLELILSDLAETGIDPRTEMIGGVYDLDEMPEMVFVAALSDAAKFEANLKEAGLPDPMEVSDDNSLKYYQLERNVYLVYNARNMVVYATEKYADEEIANRAARCFALDDNFAKSDAYAALQKEQGFTKMLLSGEELMKMREVKRNLRNMPATALHYVDLVKETDIVAAVKMEKGALTASYQIYADKPETIEAWKQMMTYTRPIKGNLLGYLPANTAATMIANLDGEKLIEYVNSLTEGQPSNPQTNMILNMLSTFKGDIALSVAPQVLEGDIPTGTLLATTTDNTIVKTVNAFGLIPSVADGENNWWAPLERYDFARGDKMTFGYVNFGYEDGITYASLTADNHRKLAKAEKPIDAGLFRGKMSALYIDMEQLMGMKPLREQIERSMRTDEAMILRMITSEIDYIEGYSTPELRAEVRVVMNNRDKTPLETYISTLAMFL